MKWPGPEPHKAYVLGCYVDKLSACGAIIMSRVITDEGLHDWSKQKHPKLTDNEISALVKLLLEPVENMNSTKEDMLCRMVSMVQEGKTKDLPNKPIFIHDDFQRGMVRKKFYRDLLLVGYFIDNMIKSGRLRGFPLVLDPDSDAYEKGSKLFRKSLDRKDLRANPGNLHNLLEAIQQTAWPEHTHVPVSISLSLSVSLIQCMCVGHDIDQ